MSDDVLVLILALMPVKDAVATSSLATRWRYVWRNLSQLNFYGPDHFCNGVRVASLDEGEREKYVNQVNSAIRSYKHPKVKDFRIRYGLNRNHKKVIDNWLEFAVVKKVEFLELDLLSISDNYDFPRRLYLYIQIIPRTPYLKKLILKNVNLTKEIFHEIIKQSPLLEMASIHYPRYLDHIQIDGQARYLKRFEIQENYYLKSICLSNLDLISSFALSLQYLSISVDEPEDFSIIDSVSELPNLKKLRLAVGGSNDDCLLFLASVLNACPNLETFSIRPCWTSPIIRRKKARDATNPHTHLKLVEIAKYKGRKCDFELAAYIIQTTVSLKKVVIAISNDSTMKEVLHSRAKLIESIKPKGVELVIV
ncbi:putative F-box/LRR-repeat protein At5g02930 [Rutidosis leptorrhynchoides]|uniref:putative F-box/LRR-repeat protein At5g02930 n=1 Tax=Rutidosis leptorrhynchoides TaxID=125765 RepID=UPI003A99A0E8